MNTREYIESGVLDMYISGLLSIEEMRDVELKACQNVEVKNELELMQSALERFILKHSLEPKAGIKEQILKAIKSDSATTTNSATLSSENHKLFEQPNKKTNNNIQAPIVHPMAPKKNLYPLFAAASIILLAVITGLTLYFFNQYNQSKEQIADLKEQQSNVDMLVNNLQSEVKRNEEKLKIVTDANMVKVTMKGTEKSPESMAMVYWNKDTKAVYFEVKVLPAAPGEKQYQLWFIDPKRGPVNAGMISGTTGEMIKMFDAPDPAAFAVTLEPRGGSKSPTLNEMVVIGTVHS